jgi:hypothetical protein
LGGYDLGAQLGSMASFAGKAISKPDTFLHSMSCDTTATLAGTTSTNIQADIPSDATSTGSGTASPDGTIHYAILSHPTSGMAGGLTKMSSVGGGKGAIPIAIEGTAAHPIYVVNTGAAERSIVSQTRKAPSPRLSTLSAVSSTGKRIRRKRSKTRKSNRSGLETHAGD